MLQYIKDRWEKEGSLTITDEEWQDICIFQWKSTKSHAWKEFCWKNIICFFITRNMKVLHYDSSNSQSRRKTIYLGYISPEVKCIHKYLMPGSREKVSDQKMDDTC